MSHRGEYERSIDFATGIVSVLFYDTDRYASTVHLCPTHFSKRKLTSSINDRAESILLLAYRRNLYCYPTKKNNTWKKLADCDALGKVSKKSMFAIYTSLDLSLHSIFNAKY